MISVAACLSELSHLSVLTVFSMDIAFFCELQVANIAQSWHETEVSIVYLRETGSGTRKMCRVGFDFVHHELIGWLWFAIAVISCE